MSDDEFVKFLKGIMDRIGTTTELNQCGFSEISESDWNTAKRNDVVITDINDIIEQKITEITSHHAA